MLLGCIGDDFTGSSDLANTLARQGMRVTQYSGIPAVPADAAVEAGVVALKSRTVPCDEAVRQSLAALEWLQAQGCTQFLFKYCSTFDSTPDGNIGPVAAALAEALSARKVLVCPAFPAAGRTIYQGHLFVQDTLLSESGMEDHPLTPMTDPDIRRWLARQTGMPVGHVAYADVAQGTDAVVAALQREDAAGRRLIVADAVADHDLMSLGTAVADLPFLTGGSGIALGLPANFRAKGLITQTSNGWAGVSGPAVVLSGSCSRATQGQVARHIERGAPAFRVTVEEILDGTITVDKVCDWAQQQQGLPLIYSTATPEEVRATQDRFGRERAAEAAEGLMADVARRLVDTGFQRIVAAGGETSGAVVEALNVTALEIGPEIAPGAPALRVGDIALALKSGNFGDADFFEKAVTVMATAI
ncbi:3-oxo-tetronate kinase [Puniceibacterium sp. IMCC21224]|uniref:3-oxo-tetronate kinase n=1 Tax=Puniceibacterium sp. IMCC21224 TaxID=1618204 RepID=UPI00064DD5CE|nr:3-oxo-tetronate kinase [Puniceibacterium sp. IMCC21224]KMK65054.1 hypothetical protein IMCC21224_12299 [Puniceibacterium sp. IMCC21224]